MHKIYIDYIYNILNLKDEKLILLLSFYMEDKDLWKKLGIKKNNIEVKFPVSLEMSRDFC